MTSPLFSGQRHVINNVMTTRVLTFSAGTSKRHDDVRDNNAFFVEILSTFKAIKSSSERSYDKQNITLVVISYEIYQIRRRLV